MRKLLITLFLFLLVSSIVGAAPFLPTKLQLTVPDAIEYAFDGSVKEIPITVAGTASRTWFLVYTKDKGNEIGVVQNGYLGWHYVNKIDTCVYLSEAMDFGIGNHTISWSGVDSDGGSVPADEYTYYIFGYDYSTPPEAQQALHRNMNQSVENSVLVKELDESGMPLANPYFTNITSGGVARKWVVGGDPTDDGLLETCDLQVPEEFRYQIPRPVCPDFYDHNIVYYGHSNKDALQIALKRATWVPNDLAVVDTEWGLESGECFRNVWAPVDDGNYLYWGKSDVYSTEPCTMRYISDREDGSLLAAVQNDFWIKPEELALGATLLQGGPRWQTMKDGTSFPIEATYFVLHACANPLRYLETFDYPDLTNCFNQNGDYVLDRAFEPEHPTPWLNFSEGAPYPNSCYADANLFTASSCRGVGAVSFALLAPDWTGIGYVAFAGEPGDTNRHVAFIDNGSAYDGMYTDGMPSDGQFRGYTGHDSLKGIITNVVSVADAAPSAFAVEQNSPNPANPNTTISFTLPESGNVTVDVFNVAGQKIDTIVNDFMDSGKHSVVWNGSAFSSGVYFYTVNSGEFSKTMKMTLLK